MENHFADRLITAIKTKQTPLVVGLDPRWERLPSSLIGKIDPADFKTKAMAYQRFCCDIMDAVVGIVPAVKPQAAFFEHLGTAGMTALANVVEHAHKIGLIVIMDAKRGDIGSTAEAYAAAFLGVKPASVWGCDSLTINPYLGDDSLQPFVTQCRATGAGIFVLVKTSNPGSQTLQELSTDSNKPIYQHVAEMVQQLTAEDLGEFGYGSIGAVVGATYPQQLCVLRSLMPNSIFLVPGLGAQGGTAADVAGGFDDQGLGAVINSSRAIIFAYQREEYEAVGDWQTAVEYATRDTVEQLATHTSAGKLRG